MAIGANEKGSSGRAFLVFFFLRRDTYRSRDTQSKIPADYSMHGINVALCSPTYRPSCPRPLAWNRKPPPLPTAHGSLLTCCMQMQCRSDLGRTRVHSCMFSRTLPQSPDKCGVRFCQLIGVITSPLPVSPNYSFSTISTLAMTLHTCRS